MSVTSQLPPGFEELEPFVAQWAAATAAERDDRRSSSTETDRNTFYAAAKVKLASALAHLDSRPLRQLDERETRLMQLMLSLAHVALAVELQGDAEEQHRQQRQHLQITRASADRP